MTYQEKPMLLTVREVAKLLRIHRPKVYQLIRDKQIDGFKLGCDWRIKRQSIEALIGPIPDAFFEQFGRGEEDEGDDEGEMKEEMPKRRIA